METGKIENIQLSFIQPNKFNPNVMQDAEFQALKEDMKQNGPEGIDPILVSPYLVFYPVEDTEENREFYGKHPTYVIVDGEHRWTAAKELSWKEIRCEIRDLDEETAKGICYRKNKDRGTIDPFKEAELFKTELKMGLKQTEIAEKFLVDPSTVSHRLSLLKLVPEVKKQIEQLPRGTITTSHLEPIATLPEGEQKKIKLREEWGNQEVKSVRAIAEEAKRIKEQLAEKEALQKALKSAKFAKCPKCGEEPRGINYRKLPWVNCSSGNWNHIWNLETGKGPYEEEKVEQKKTSGEKSEPIKTSVLRSTHTIDELSDIFAERLREMVPKVQQISSFNIRGKLENNQDFSADFSGYGNSMMVSVHLGNGYFFFNAEKKDYRTGEKSKVNARSPDYVERTKLFIESAFQGKLEIPSEERIKGSTPEDTPTAEDSAEKEDPNLEIPCFDCTNDSENGGKCHRTKFVAQEDVGGYTCKSKVQLSGEELAKKKVDAEPSQTPGQ